KQAAAVVDFHAGRAGTPIAAARQEHARGTLAHITTEDRAVGGAADEEVAARGLVGDALGEDRVSRQDVTRAAGAHLVAEQAQQNVVGRLILGVELEAPSLEPLYAVFLAFDQFWFLIAERHPEQAQVFGLAFTPAPVDLQSVRMPGLEDVAADVM